MKVTRKEGPISVQFDELDQVLIRHLAAKHHIPVNQLAQIMDDYATIRAVYFGA